MVCLSQFSLLAELSLHMLSGGEVGDQSSAGMQDSAVRKSSTTAVGTGAIQSDSSTTGVLHPIAPNFTGIESSRVPIRRTCIINVLTLHYSGVMQQLSPCDVTLNHL